MAEPRLPAVGELVARVEQRAGEQGAAAELRTAIALGHELATLSDAVIGCFVARARGAGLSWTEIGETFGISKQAAQQRYGTTSDEAVLRPDRWTPACRQALDRAVGEASSLRHDYVGTEHVLLALVSAEAGVASDVLRSVGITRERMLATSCMKPAPRDQEVHACLAFMPRLEQALEQSRRIAEALDARLADTEHLLAGIVAVTDSMAVELLRRLGVSDADVVRALAERLAVEPQRLGKPRR